MYVQEAQLCSLAWVQRNSCYPTGCLLSKIFKKKIKMKKQRNKGMVLIRMTGLPGVSALVFLLFKNVRSVPSCSFPSVHVSWRLSPGCFRKTQSAAPHFLRGTPNYMDWWGTDTSQKCCCISQQQLEKKQQYSAVNCTPWPCSLNMIYGVSLPHSKHRIKSLFHLEQINVYPVIVAHKVYRDIIHEWLCNSIANIAELPWA